MSDANDALLARLAAESEIRNLVARVAHLADDGDLDEYLSLWMPDASWQRDDDEPLRGHAALLSGARQRRADGVQGPGTDTRHINTTLWVRVDGPDQGVVQSYYLYVGNASNSPMLIGSGRYDDTVRRSADGWKMASRRITVDVNATIR